MRTLVLAAGVLLVIALGVFLAIGKWKNPFNRRDLPKRLGIDIQQEANGWVYSHALGAHSQYEIHASKEVQYKQGNAVLHDVKIELYGDDGRRVDRIEGNTFEFDQKADTVTATGPVEITLMRPTVAPAIAPKATPDQLMTGKPITKPLATAAETAATGQIHVETSGLIFNRKTGVATTEQHVDFSMTQGNGSSLGASYDSQKGFLILDHAVELNTRRGGDMVLIHAAHAEFDRTTHLCHLSTATADYRGGQATAGAAQILFREDGSAVRLDASSGFTATTATGSHLVAPTGSVDFDEHNQPRRGHLEGGVRMDSDNNGRRMHGTAPTAQLEFTAKGELSHTHLERGVEMHSEDVSQPTAGAEPVHVSRTWRSPVADVDFRDNGHGQAEPSRIHGTQGVVVTSESQRGKAAAMPSRLQADEVTGDFGPNSVLTAMNGTGHAAIEETTATGGRETSTGDRLEAHFAPAGAAGAKGGADSAARVQSAVLDGHVVMVQEPAAKPGAQPGSPLRAWAGRAVYEGAGQWLHLTLSPRVEDGGLQLTADKVDVSQESGDAFAHGNVKATWVDIGTGMTGSGAGEGHAGRSTSGAPGQSNPSLGGTGPSHAISAEAQLHRTAGGASNEATFRGHARLWQEANSVAGPAIVLNREKQTLTAQSADPAEPVRVVLLNASGPGTSASGSGTGSASGKQAQAAGDGGNKGSGDKAQGRSSTPSVIRVHGGNLNYSDAERKAVMRGGSLGTVVAETGTATAVSDEVELYLTQAGNSAAKSGASGQTSVGAPSQVDRMTASGHVTLNSEGRRGTGEQLVYTSADGQYVLTGTAAAPPRMTDPAHGTVTGEALIFNSRDDSVSVEGRGRRTTTDTRTQK